jgi:hypothetical protein
VEKLLLYGDRLVLLYSVLSRLPVFMLSFFSKYLNGLGKDRFFLDHDSFLQSDGHNRKYRLARYNIICQPKYQRGLGVEVLEIKNKCLLSKLLFNIFT